MNQQYKQRHLTNYCSIFLGIGLFLSPFAETHLNYLDTHLALNHTYNDIPATNPLNRSKKSLLPPCSLTVTNTAAACHANGTTENRADDYIVFSINITGASPNSQTFTVTGTQNGNPISIQLANGSAATAVNCGLDAALRTATGTAGQGAITLTITDNVDNCSTTLNIADAGSCATNCVAGVTQTVTYSYATQVDLTELNSLPIVMPQFDQQGGHQKLTKVTLDYTVGELFTAILENSAVNPQTFIARMSSDITLDLNNNTIATSNLAFSSGLRSLTAGVLVPAQGAWAGDVAYGNGSNVSTLYGMSSWLNNSLSYMKDPRTDSRWVTTVTGNPNAATDIYYFPVTQKTATGSITYTTQSDLASFKGNGQVPLVVSTLTGTTLSGGGGNLIFLQRTRGFANAQITYFYECLACPQTICLPISVIRN
jgi:hypothetical protein